ncbi:MAG: helix-turn-helix domain-containing protein [Rhizobiales bacterium]|nr:helix-turn-helix domain-containing protein [Hyphomicrobiales bacterium]
MPPEDFAPIRVSTDALPVRERLPFCREVVGRKLVKLDVDPLSDAPFKAEATLFAWPGLHAASWVGVAARWQRGREHVADGDDSLAIVINRSGTVTRSQRDRDASLGVGDAAVILHAEPAVMTHSQVHYESLSVPRAALLPLVANIEDAAMRMIPHTNDALRLLMGYLKLVHEGLPLATPELRHRVVMHVHDLVATAIGATRDGTAIAEQRGVRAARLAAIKADIVARLDRRDLSPAAVAARQQVTPRYVQLLFEREGTTFSQFVLEQRLVRAHHMLTSMSHAGWTVSAIALASGFGDLSHFNRSFRRRYGATPSDVRCAAQRT